MLDTGWRSTLDKPTLVTPFVVETARLLMTYTGNHLGELDLPENLTHPPWEDGWLPVGSRGKISKRIAAWLRESTGVNLEVYERSRIGDFASLAYIPAGAVITITNDFAWNPGDYGDRDSCFFKSRRQAFPLLRRLGGRAALFCYKDALGAEVRARCLILDDDKGRPVLFNSYGQALEQAACLASELAMSKMGIEQIIMTKAAFRILDSNNWPIYINKSVGFALHDKDGVIDDLRRNKDVEELAHDQGLRQRTYCEHCATELDTEGRRVMERQGGHDDNIAFVCRQCAPLVRASKERKWTGGTYETLNIASYPSLRENRYATQFDSLHFSLSGLTSRPANRTVAREARDEGWINSLIVHLPITISSCIPYSELRPLVLYWRCAFPVEPDMPWEFIVTDFVRYLRTGRPETWRSICHRAAAGRFDATHMPREVIVEWMTHYLIGEARRRILDPFPVELIVWGRALAIVGLWAQGMIMPAMRELRGTPREYDYFCAWLREGEMEF